MAININWDRMRLMYFNEAADRLAPLFVLQTTLLAVNQLGDFPSRKHQ
ncbi:Uncharacterised protein [Vibrio cholerae]|nr:Uncharacterised protein [Vibrio cholerae]CSB29112.1 Uncharacterised protein [Vibrio cholerae]CSB29707.1 Uncharacterised protein [Vibrio cholerae]